MYYNLTQLNNAGSITGWVSFINSNTGGVFTGLMYFAFFFVLVFNLRRYGFDNALAASSFVCSMIGFLLFNADMLGFWYFAAMLMTMVLSGLWIFKNS